MKIKKIIVSLAVVCSLIMNVGVVFASNGSRPGDLNVEDRTVIPKTEKNLQDCRGLINDVKIEKQKYKDLLSGRNPENEQEIRDVLGCAITTGDIALWMIPFYVRYILELLLQLSGLIAIGGIIYGSYLYVFSYVIEDKDEGKRAILYGVIGLVVSLLAWVFVNLFISALT
jgi:hypothetical protein